MRRRLVASLIASTLEGAINAPGELLHRHFQTLDLRGLTNRDCVQLAQGVLLVSEPGLQIDQLFIKVIHTFSPEHQTHGKQLY